MDFFLVNYFRLFWYVLYFNFFKVIFVLLRERDVLVNRKWWIILIIMKFYMFLNMSICDILEIYNILRKMLEFFIFICFYGDYSWLFNRYFLFYFGEKLKDVIINIRWFIMYLYFWFRIFLSWGGGEEIRYFYVKCFLSSFIVCIGMKMKDGSVVFMMDFIVFLCL